MCRRIRRTAIPWASIRSGWLRISNGCAAGTDPAEQRFADLVRQCSHFDVLCLAALLHDAGKLVPGRDHSETGAELAKTVSDRLSLPPEKRELLDVLIRQHLLLVRTARLHDLKSANVIQKAAEQVPSLEALQHLYVLTYVDTCAVAEKNWTSMDDRDLEDLYRRMQGFYASSASETASGVADGDSSRPDTEKTCGAADVRKSSGGSRNTVSPCPRGMY